MTIKLFIFGDSYSKCFIRDKIKYNYKDKLIVVNHYRSSSSAKGLIKFNNSNLKYGTYIKNFIKTKVKNEDYVLFNFGHCDINYNLMYKILIKKEVISNEEHVINVTNEYMKFIEEIYKIHKRIIICGIQLPIRYNNVYKIRYLTNNIWFKHLNLKKIPDRFKYEKQIKLNLYFNDIISKSINKKNLLYIDYTDELFDFNDYDIKKKFLIKNHTDTHYKGAETNINAFSMEYSKDLNYLFLEKVYQLIK